MIPYGKDKKMRHNYTDCHPKKLGKNVVNWWEVELGGIDKGAERQQAKTEIRKELNGQYN
jgi:hypothetical protein